MIVYAIRHKPSGNFLPQTNSKHHHRKSGFTYDEPVPATERLPRLFLKPGPAKCALTYWLSGEWREEWYRSYLDGEDEPELVCKKVPGRKAEDMEVTAVVLMLCVPDLIDLDTEVKDTESGQVIPAAAEAPALV